MPARFIRLKEVMGRTGFARSTIYAKAKVGAFPKGVSLGPSLTVWVETEVEQWILAKIQSRDEIDAAIQPVSNRSNLVQMPARSHKVENISDRKNCR